MTSSNVQDIRTYKFQSGDKVFFDANIWLSIYGPFASGTKTGIYSSALKTIRQAGCNIYIDVMILSEFINTYARYEFRRLRLKEKDFKKFRQSSNFKASAYDIGQSAKRIVKQCQSCESNFSTVNIESLLTDFESGNFDFNDQVIAKLCQSKGLTLITHDSDFKGEPISILTANNKLLSV